MKSLRIALSVAAGLAIMTNGASAQQYARYLEVIEIPTDLVAPVVSTEDSISDTTRHRSVTVADQPVVEVVPEPSVDGTSSQGSIFADLAPSEPVPEDPEPDTRVAAMESPVDGIAGSNQSAGEDVVEPVHNETGDETGNQTTGAAVEQTGAATSVASTQPPGTGGNIFSGLEPDTLDPSPSVEAMDTGQADTSSSGEQDIPTASPGTATAGTDSTQSDTGTSAVADSPPQQPVNEDVLISGWANAWSSNDTEAYLDYYADDFVPADPAMSRDEWEQLRRERLKNENIRIIVSNAELTLVQPQLVEVQFTQRYTSKNYRDRIIKAIEMKHTDDGWKFVSERTVEKLAFE